ncbi:hypothetical protein ig2599ANME_0706 [groundwater metagenome]
MDKEINIILAACSVITGFIGFFFVLKIWLVWKRVDINVLKARVFLDPKFLIRNWVFIFIAGAFIIMRRILHLFDLLELPKLSSEMTIIVDFMGLAVVVLLVFLAYYWYKLVDSAVDHNTRKDAPGLQK